MFYSNLFAAAPAQDLHHRSTSSHTASWRHSSPAAYYEQHRCSRQDGTAPNHGPHESPGTEWRRRRNPRPRCGWPTTRTRRRPVEASRPKISTTAPFSSGRLVRPVIWRCSILSAAAMLLVIHCAAGLCAVWYCSKHRRSDSAKRLIAVRSIFPLDARVLRRNVGSL